MYRYTDVPLTLTINGADLTGAQDIHVTFAQGVYKTLDITDAVLVGTNTLTLTLTQKQSGAFDGQVECQVNWIDANGKRKATDKAVIPVWDNLLRHAIEVTGDG